jgi:hypothetical protein
MNVDMWKRAISLSKRLSLVLLLGAPACTPAPAADDEAGVTTAMGDSSDSVGASDSVGTSDSVGASDSTSESGSTGGSDSTETFLPILEDQSTEPCSNFEQDCPEGEKCVPYSLFGTMSWDDHKCVPVLGDQAPGEPCVLEGFAEAIDDCDATSICFFTEEVDGQLLGECVAQCVGWPDNPMCTAPGHSCLLDGEGDLALCLSGCDPVVQDCTPGDACYWTGGALACLPAGQGVPLGEPCESLDDCSLGQQCIDGAQLPSCAGTGCCTQFCDLFDDGTCLDQPGTVCVPFFEQGMAPAGLEHVGLCTLPL